MDASFCELVYRRFSNSYTHTERVCHALRRTNRSEKYRRTPVVMIRPLVPVFGELNLIIPQVYQLRGNDEQGRKIHAGS